MFFVSTWPRKRLRVTEGTVEKEKTLGFNSTNKIDTVFNTHANGHYGYPVKYDLKALLSAPSKIFVMGKHGLRLFCFM